jgi:hypothetical protein
MPKNMKRDMFAFEIRHSAGRCGDSATQDVSGTEACQTLPLRTDEYGNVIVTVYAAFLQEIVNGVGDIDRQRDHPLFATFSSQHYLRTYAV